MADSNWADIYKELGATPVNKRHRQRNDAGRLHAGARSARSDGQGGRAYIPLMDLQESAGDAPSPIWSMCQPRTSHRAQGSALTLATAALMAGDDDDKIQQLPDTTGMKNENPDPAAAALCDALLVRPLLELAGAKLVDFGTDERTTREDLENAIGPNTAGVHYYAVEQTPDPDALSLEDTIEIAHARGVPVTVGRGGADIPAGKLRQVCADGRGTSSASPAKYMGAPAVCRACARH